MSTTYDFSTDPNRVTLRINVMHVITVDNQHALIKAGNRSTYETGKAVSSYKQILVNDVGNSNYSINISLTDCMMMKPEAMGKTIVNLLSTNLPNRNVDLYVEWFSEEEWKRIADLSGSDNAKQLEIMQAYSLMNLTVLMDTIEDMSSLINVHRDNFPEIELVEDDEEDDDDECAAEDDDDEYDEYDENEYDESPSFEDIIDNLYKGIGKMSGEKKKKYPTSKVIKNAKKPKRSYHRHGVLIAKKSNIVKDRATIKSFLKDFIPGSETWKKEFRNDLADRWIKTFVITAKKLKSLEKSQRHKKNKKVSGNRTRKAMEYTRQLLTVPIDRWSDPSK